MHDTAYEIGGTFIREYSSNKSNWVIVEIGSMDVNGSLRHHVDMKDTYLGLDVEHGKSVDLIINPLDPLPFRDDFADIVLSSSQMEHDKFFWKTFLEMVRITNTNGYIYISAPSNGDYHSYPIDCWRFYPESGLALAEWARANGLPCELVESFTADRKADVWNDYVAIFQKCAPEHVKPICFISDRFSCYNVRKFGSDEVINRSDRTEDFRLLAKARQDLVALQNEIAALKDKISILETELMQAKTSDHTEAAG